MFKRKYEFYISYNFINSNGPGFGSIDLTRTKPIKSFDDMSELIEDIKKVNNLDSVVITNIYRIK